LYKFWFYISNLKEAIGLYPSINMSKILIYGIKYGGGGGEKW